LFAHDNFEWIVSGHGAGNVHQHWLELVAPVLGPALGANNEALWHWLDQQQPRQHLQQASAGSSLNGCSLIDASEDSFHI